MTQRRGAYGVPIPAGLCGAYGADEGGEHMCRHPEGHAGAHDWERDYVTAAAQRQRDRECHAPWIADGGYLDGAPLYCLLPRGHSGDHAVRLHWNAEGWAPARPYRCDAARAAWGGVLRCDKAFGHPEPVHRQEGIEWA